MATAVAGQLRKLRQAALLRLGHLQRLRIDEDGAAIVAEAGSETVKVIKTGQI